MKEETPKDITPIKRKGIEMAVKGLHKKFPFIIGYKDDTTDQYQSAHYIDLIIDLQKLSDYMEVPINPYWLKLVEDKPHYEKIYAMWSYLTFPNEEQYNDDVKNHPGYMLQKNITDLIQTIYEYIPEEYKMFYDYHSEWTNTTNQYPITIKINAFIMK